MTSKVFYKSFLSIILIFVILSCKKNQAAATPELTISPAVASFTNTGGTSNIIVNSNVSWSVSLSASWCTATALTSNGNGNIIIKVQPNATNQQRSAVLSVTAGSVSKTLQITQGPIDSIPPDETGMRNITAMDLTKEMVAGWNLGNTLDAIGGETAWGNPLTTQLLIDSVKAAGFNAVRIPIAWSKFSDSTTFTIDTNWMARVEHVVNYVLNDNMYAIINIHWDGGWMQPTYAQQTYVNNRLAVMWRQIAIRFRNYNDHLLFAGTNEVTVTNDYNTPTTENYTVQNGFNQTFVTTVRSTGGRNAYRNLVIQSYDTNINYAVSYMQMPKDNIANKLIVEIHYYDPSDFTINSSSSIIQWGKYATNPAETETWANEAYADGQFQKMQTNFIAKGYPVIMGEYAAMARTQLGSAAANASYAFFRNYYMRYITSSASSHSVIPFYWDSGNTGNFGSGLFNRNTGAKVYPDIVKSITGK